MIEVVPALALWTTGWLVQPRLLGSARRRAAMALPVAVAVFSIVLLLLLAVPGASLARPTIALGVALVVAAVIAYRRGEPVVTGDDRRVLGVAALAGLATTVLVTTVPLVVATSDTWRYLATGEVLAEFGNLTRLSGFQLESRALTTGALHLLAGADPGYFRAVGPLVGASTLVLVWDVVRHGTSALDRRLSLVVAAAAVLLLATNDRFLFTALYVNGHSLLAAQVLVVASISWLVVRQDVPATGAVGGLLAVTLAGAGLVRPDAWLLMAMVVLPLVVDARVPLAVRRPALVGLGAAAMLWHAGPILSTRLDSGSTVPVSTIGLIALGALLVVAGLGLPVLDRLVADRRPLAVAHVGLWALVVVLGVRTPQIVVDAVVPTIVNIGWQGRWGTALVVLAVLLVTAVLWVRVREEQVLLFPLVSFVPLALLFALLREGGYRVGPGDSLNRSLIHIVPLAIVALAVTAGGEDRGLFTGLRRRLGGDVAAQR